MATERRRSPLLSEFARTLLTGFPIQGILDRLVVRITEVLPVWSAGIALISAADTRRHVAASDDSALRFVKLQTELGERSCLTAHRTGQAAVFPDLQTENDHFPGFARRALEAGCGAVSSSPLADDHHRLGALDLSDRVGSALAEPFVPSGSEILVGASVGGEFAGLGEDVSERVLEGPDSAMYQVKRSAGGRHAVIDLREHRSANHRARPNRDLRGALLREELSVHHQSIVATNSGRLDTDTDHRKGSHGY